MKKETVKKAIKELKNSIITIAFGTQESILTTSTKIQILEDCLKATDEDFVVFICYKSIIAIKGEK